MITKIVIIEDNKYEELLEKKKNNSADEFHNLILDACTIIASDIETKLEETCLSIVDGELVRTWECTNCGTRYFNSHINYCSECGYKISKVINNPVHEKRIID